MSLVAVVCAHCGAEAMKEAGGVNRARRAGAPLYCGQACSGLARRKHKTAAQKQAEKKAYDQKRRLALIDEIKAAKRAYHVRTYDPAVAAIKRKERMPKHVEYCRRPAYRQKKKAYDHVYNAKRGYGPLWEAQLLVLDIRNAVLERQSDYEIRLAKGTLGKTQQRKRAYDQNHRTGTQRQVPEVGPLVNLERGERR
jgi:hypothetical protein